MYLPKRPKPAESEDEILADEKAFLETLRSAHAPCRQGQGQKFEPAAKAVRRKAVVEVDKVLPIPEPQNHDGQPSEPAPCRNMMDTNNEEEETMDGDSLEEEDPNIEAVVQDTIIEKSFDSSKLMAFPIPTPLPKVSVKTNVGKSLFAQGLVLPNTKRTGKSLFAQMFDAKYGPEEGTRAANSSSGETTCSTSFGEGGKIIMGDLVHPYLTGMTQSQILEEQKKLVDKLDPRLVEFVRSRQSKKQIIEPKQNIYDELGFERPRSRDSEEGVDVMMTNVNINQDGILPQDESELPIDPRTVCNIPGMGKLESDKLEWTGVVKENRKKFDKLEDGESARFDFDGMLMTGKEGEGDEKSFDKGLHHHGEDMEKPGYTFEELLTLARSVNNQQKARALQIIGNIYAKAHTGMYDFVMEKNLFELWEYMDFVYAIRKGLDEGNKTLINEAIHCLANIVYPWEEELCLDIVHSWEYSKPHPWISTKSENLNASLDPGEDESGLNDEEMLKIDFLEFFIHRSSLLDRLAYCMKGEWLSEGGVDGIFKILIRVARHSPNALVDHELLGIIVKNYTNPNWNHTTGKHPYFWKAFKILRILIDSSSTNAYKISNDYNIFPSILSYLAYDDWDSSVQMPQYIVIESFRIWIALISHRIAVDEYRPFFPILMKFFVMYQSIDELSSFDLLHSGYVFSLLLAILNMREEASGVHEGDKHSHWTLVKDCVAWVEKIAVKLTTIISSPHLDSSYDEGALYWSLSRALLFLIESAKYDSQSITEKFICAINAFLTSQHYGRITSQLRKHSVILASIDTSSRYPNNFASVNALSFGGNCNPIIVFGNALPLLTAIYSLGKCISDRISVSAIIDSNVNEYVKDLSNSTQSQLPPSFFVRYELAFLLRLLELYPLNSSAKFYVAYKAISETPKCCSRLFNNLFKIALSSSCAESEIDMCYKMYGGYLLLAEQVPMPDNSENTEVPKKKVTFSEDTKITDGPSEANLLFEKWSERSIESHWILEPMQRIRTIVDCTPGFLSSNLGQIELQCRICLKLISQCLQQHCDFVIQTPKDFLDVYCAVCQVFLLGDPRIYIGEEISPILVQILNSLLTCTVLKKYSNKRIFSKHKQTPGRPNMFLDFYPDLIKEYSENSYFNEIFANYILLPLRIPEDPRLRSHFWIMETIQFLKINSSKALVPQEYLTSGTEKDSVLLDIYFKLIRSRKITKDQNGFLFDVVTANIRNAVNAPIDISDDKLVKLREAFLQLQV